MLEVFKRLTNSIDLQPKEEVFGSDLTVIGIGGKIPLFVEVNTVDQLSKLIKLLKKEGLLYRVIGRGSNIFFSDTPKEIPLIKLGGDFKFFQQNSDDTGSFKVGAAYSLMQFARNVSNQGYAGIEFAGGIPASIGGAVFMNAGAYGGELVNVIEKIDLINDEGEIISAKSSDFNFKYRSSGIPKEWIIIGAEIRLAVGDRERSLKLLEENNAKRRATQPVQYPSSGSCFRNPPTPPPAGVLLDQTGMKGMKRGGAEVSEMHANWIVNKERLAKAVDVLSLIEEGRSRVRERFNIDLELEVFYWD
ncbi:MAG TPA: UDP-N-acetylmuramate dehydrogenase [Oligoflexia bacterium]|nr:UDP-N-acetylmuramate dehydrogenase [Oligoflexia bacterium]HMP26582.1 UDP-N-acetylmuramate dehydrogenase [Oligoflexia bacterium]